LPDTCIDRLNICNINRKGDKGGPIECFTPDFGARTVSYKQPRNELNQLILDSSCQKSIGVQVNSLTRVLRLPCFVCNIIRDHLW